MRTLSTALENRMGTLKTISDYNNAIGRGAAVGFGDFALGLQSLAGKTVKAAGDVFAPPRTLSSLVTDEVPMNRVQKAGKWLVDDAEQGRKKLAAELAPDKEKHPWSAGGGEIAGNLALAIPATRVLGSAVAMAGPPMRMAGVMTPLGESIATGGMRVGGPLAEAKGASAVAQRVANHLSPDFWHAVLQKPCAAPGQWGPSPTEKGGRATAYAAQTRLKDKGAILHTGRQTFMRKALAREWPKRRGRSCGMPMQYECCAKITAREGVRIRDMWGHPSNVSLQDPSWISTSSPP